MTFDEYQEQSQKTAAYPEDRNFSRNVTYLTLGLASEAGEVAGKIKKILRDEAGEISAEHIEQVKGELGDVLWYISQLANELELSLNDVAEKNVQKLSSRKERGTIQGSGDNR